MSNIIMIAEIAGSFKTFDEAKVLLNKLALEGVSVVKLQTFIPELLCSPDAIFEMENTGKRRQMDVFKEEACPYPLQEQIFDYSKSIGLKAFSTPSHKRDVDFLVSCGVDWLKIGSDDALNFDLIEYCSRKAEKLFVSTGMSTYPELIEIGEFLVKLPCDVVMMHCVTSYPAVAADLNINVLSSLAEIFPDLTLGYSDHFAGVEACHLAFGLGARVFEKHVYLDDTFEGVDKSVGMTANNLSCLIESLELMHSMLGSSRRQIGAQEKINRQNNRKSLHACNTIKAGTKIQPQNVIALRPGNGITPNNVHQILGKIASKDIEAGSQIKIEHLEG
jgi:N,N'-diacetyllegionaminate synthase